MPIGKINNPILARLDLATPNEKQLKPPQPIPVSAAYYLEQRAKRQRALLDTPSINPFMHVTNPYRRTEADDQATRQNIHNLLAWIKPIRADLELTPPRNGYAWRPTGDILCEIADVYTDYAAQNRVIEHLTIEEFAIAYLYLRADIPMWLAMLPQMRENRIKPNWKPFIDQFEKVLQKIEGLAPALHRCLYRGVSNTNMYTHRAPGDLVTMPAPSSCSQNDLYANAFVFHDTKDPCPAKTYITKGDALLQLWDTQDAVNLASVWEDPECFDDEVRNLQKTEHILQRGTQYKVLLNAGLYDPNLKRDYQHLVLQDVRSSHLGQEPRLLEALTLPITKTENKGG